MSKKEAKESAENFLPKRQRLGAATFHDIHADVLVNVLSFLTRDDMDNASILTASLVEARNHPSLDQTRTATIVICKSKTIHDLYATIASKGWEAFFSSNSNKKHLKVQGLEKLEEPDDYTEGWVDRAPHGHIRFESITSLDMSAPPKAVQTKEMNSSDVEGVTHILPNLQELDLSHVQDTNMYVEGLGRALRNVTRLKWKGCDGFLSCIDAPSRLTHLNLDDSCGDATGYGFEFHMAMEMGTMHSFCLFKNFAGLERLSLKNAQSKEYGSNVVQPISQECLIKIVRFHPTLRWLRSDLTDANIAMLNVERPEVTLVNTEEQSPESEEALLEREHHKSQALALVQSATAQDCPWLEAVVRQAQEKLQEHKEAEDERKAQEEADEKARMDALVALFAPMSRLTPQGGGSSKKKSTKKKGGKKKKKGGKK